MAASTTVTESKLELTPTQLVIQTKGKERYRDNINKVSGWAEFDKKSEIIAAYRNPNAARLFALTGLDNFQSNCTPTTTLYWLCNALLLDPTLTELGSEPSLVSQLKETMKSIAEDKHTADQPFDHLCTRMICINAENKSDRFCLPDSFEFIYKRLNEVHRDGFRLSARLFYSTPHKIAEAEVTKETPEIKNALCSFYGWHGASINPLLAIEKFKQLAKAALANNNISLYTGYLFFAADMCRGVEPKDVYLLEAAKLYHTGIRAFINHNLQLDLTEILFCEHILRQIKKTYSHNTSLILAYERMVADAYHLADPVKKVQHLKTAYDLAKQPIEEKKEEKKEEKEENRTPTKEIEVEYVSALHHAKSRGHDLYEQAADIKDASIQIVLAKKEITSADLKAFNQSIARLNQALELIALTDVSPKSTALLNDIWKTLPNEEKIPAADTARVTAISTLKEKLNTRLIAPLLHTIIADEEEKGFSAENMAFLTANKTQVPCALLLAYRNKDKIFLRQHAKQSHPLATLLLARLMKKEGNKKLAVVLYALLVMEVRKDLPFPMKIMRKEASDFLDECSRESAFLKISIMIKQFSQWVRLQQVTGSPFQTLRKKIENCTSIRVIHYLLKSGEWKPASDRADYVSFSAGDCGRMNNFFCESLAYAYGFPQEAERDLEQNTEFNALLNTMSIVVSLSLIPIKKAMVAPLIMNSSSIASSSSTSTASHSTSSASSSSSVASSTSSTSSSSSSHPTNPENGVELRPIITHFFGPPPAKITTLLVKGNAGPK